MTQTILLGELIDITSGFAFSSKRFSESKGTPIIRIRDVSKGFTSLKFDGEFDERFLAQDDDLLITMDGEFRVQEWKGGPALINQRVCRVEPQNGKLDRRFLRHFLPPKLKEIEDRTPFVTVKHLSAKSIREIELPKIDIDEQKRIAAILDKADAIRRKREQALTLADDFLRSVFLDMFGDPVINNKKLPDGSVADFEEFITSGSRGWAKYYSDSGAIFLRIGNVGRGRLKLDDLVRVDAPDSAEAKRTRVRSGDILLSITADLGRSAVVPEELEGAHINQHLAILRLRGISPHYVSAYLSSIGGQRQFKQLDKVGVKSGLNFNDLRSLRILVPSKEMQLKFEHTIQKTETIRLQLLSSLCEANLLFASLSQRAFRGEL